VSDAEMANLNISPPISTVSGTILSHQERPVIEAIVQAQALMRGLVAACPISVRAVPVLQWASARSWPPSGGAGFPHREPAPACTTADRVLWLDGANRLSITQQQLPPTAACTAFSIF
jgi:hypothetical protein